MIVRAGIAKPENLAMPSRGKDERGASLDPICRAPRFSERVNLRRDRIACTGLDRGAVTRIRPNPVPANTGIGFIHYGACSWAFDRQLA